MAKRRRRGLRGAREAAGLSQRQVAERLFVTVRTVRRWESGESRPSSVRLAAMERLYSPK